MPELTRLPFAKGQLNAVLSAFFSRLLEAGAVEAILVPTAQRHGGVMQTLITAPRQTAAVDPFAPVVPVSSAKLTAALTARPSGKPTAVVLRSCEVRALLELVKLKQATLDDLLLVGIDCLGRFESRDFLELQRQGVTTELFLQKAVSGDTTLNGHELAAACRICEYPEPEHVDLRIELLGAQPGAVYLEWLTEKARSVRGKLDLAANAQLPARPEAVARLTQRRSRQRDERLAAFRETTHTFEALTRHLAGCMNCYNCRVACPVCYCKECVFVTDAFRHHGIQYLGWAKRDGALKMPCDTMFYHLVRLTHISTLCVGCGQCTSACPNGIDLMPLFRATAQNTQARFDYVAGRSPEEQQPLAVFHDDEFLEVTGQPK
jgi:formate dehydrogenase subunit beta